MSNYTVTTNFLAKDSLVSGNPSKLVKGADLTTEFNNIATMSPTKVDFAASGSSIVLNSATGGDQGAGSINAGAGLYINGAVVSLASIIANKSGTTSRSTTTPANDPALVVAIPGAGTYQFAVQFLLLNASGASIGNINYSGTFAAGSGYCASGQFTGANAAGYLIASAVTATTLTAATTAAGGSWLTIQGVLFATGAGNLGFSWSANGVGSSVVGPGLFTCNRVA